MTLCDQVHIKSHERSECISRLNMLYKNGVFPTLRIPIKTIIARLFDMMGLTPEIMQFAARDPMPKKCVAYTIDDNEENLVKCFDMEVIRPFLDQNLIHFSSVQRPRRQRERSGNGSFQRNMQSKSQKRRSPPKRASSIMLLPMP